MAKRDVLLLGDPRLYLVSRPVRPEETASLAPVVEDLRDTLLDFRARHGAGRGIAAPQIGLAQRLIYLHLDEPMVLINPELVWKSPGLIEVWDDCMSHPDLFVRLRRHRACRLAYRDLEWRERFWEPEGDLSELVQHELDHLDGVLAVARALDGRSFALRGQGIRPGVVKEC